jgi:hypothetical protein
MVVNIERAQSGMNTVFGNLIVEGVEISQHLVADCYRTLQRRCKVTLRARSEWVAIVFYRDSQSVGGVVVDADRFDQEAKNRDWTFGYMVKCIYISCTSVGHGRR